MDTLSKEHRSWNMSRIRSKHTKPELFVRSTLHSMGYRFRLHPGNIFGSPDIVLPRHKLVIFVHGCFWHRHKGCRFAYNPKSRIQFWQTKFRNNVERDKKVRRALKREGWKVLIVWECKVHRGSFSARLRNDISRLLND